jgi:hypothetical protein
MDPGLRAELTNYYLPHDDALGAWLGRMPIWRRT